MKTTAFCSQRACKNDKRAGHFRLCPFPFETLPRNDKVCALDGFLAVMERVTVTKLINHCARRLSWRLKKAGK